jgi:hypothetical protein
LTAAINSSRVNQTKLSKTTGMFPSRFASTTSNVTDACPLASRRL